MIKEIKKIELQLDKIAKTFVLIERIRHLYSHFHPDISYKVKLNLDEVYLTLRDYYNYIENEKENLIQKLR